MTTWNGMTIAATNKVKIALESLVRVLSKTHAAIAEKIVIPVKEKTVMITELNSAWVYPIFGLFKMFWMFVINVDQLVGIAKGVCMISLFVLLALIKTRNSGIRNIMTKAMVKTSEMFLRMIFLLLIIVQPRVSS
jgi:hypothetical protein